MRLYSSFFPVAGCVIFSFDDAPATPKEELIWSRPYENACISFQQHLLIWQPNGEVDRVFSFSFEEKKNTLTNSFTEWKPRMVYLLRKNQANNISQCSCFICANEKLENLILRTEMRGHKLKHLVIWFFSLLQTFSLGLLESYKFDSIYSFGFFVALNFPWFYFFLLSYLISVRKWLISIVTLWKWEYSPEYTASSQSKIWGKKKVKKNDWFSFLRFLIAVQNDEKSRIGKHLYVSNAPLKQKLRTLDWNRMNELRISLVACLHEIFCRLKIKSISPSQFS